jgi:hypothetical protein
MTRRIWIALLVGGPLLCLFVPRGLQAQTCKDDETIAEEYKKRILDLVQTVKKESLEDFQKAYHQKNAFSKLTFCLTGVDGLLSCLDKAAQDATATKEEVEASKAKRATYAKLKGKIQHDRDALKAAESAKDAKALIEKIDLSL